MLEDKSDKCIQMVFSRRPPPLPTPCSSPPLPRLLHSSPPPSSITYFLIFLNSFQRSCVRCIFHRVVIEWSPHCVTKIVTRHTRCYVCLIVFLSQHTNTTHPLLKFSRARALSLPPDSLSLTHLITPWVILIKRKVEKANMLLEWLKASYTNSLRLHTLVA